MKISLLKCLFGPLLLLIYCHSSESLFFQGPGKAIWNLIETLGGHKHGKPIHHYHMHYYPVPLPVLLPKPAPPPPPPSKIEIDLSGLHSNHEQIRSLGWPSEDYGAKLHDSDFLGSPQPEAPWASGKYLDAWQDPSLLQQKSWSWDNNELLEKDHVYKEAKPQGILLQVPLKQQIVFYQPPAKDTKPSLLSIFFKKIRRINDALFHPEEEECIKQHDDKPHISNSLTYATL